jgi:hypothetical protein
LPIEGDAAKVRFPGQINAGVVLKCSKACCTYSVSGRRSDRSRL